MAISTFSSLLETWEKAAQKDVGKVTRQVSLYESDEVKIRALAAMYALPVEEITASLIHQAIIELEEKMPYVPGHRVIRVEEGSDIYEDIGPMARYLEVQGKLRE